MTPAVLRGSPRGRMPYAAAKGNSGEGLIRRRPSWRWQCRSAPCLAHAAPPRATGPRDFSLGHGICMPRVCASPHGLRLALAARHHQGDAHGRAGILLLKSRCRPIASSYALLLCILSRHTKSRLPCNLAVMTRNHSPRQIQPLSVRSSLRQSCCLTS